jgi:hypothetical protein
MILPGELNEIFPIHLLFDLFTANNTSIGVYICQKCGSLVWENSLANHYKFHENLAVNK